MRICEHCGARLDPGERCDCRDFRVLVLRADGTKEIVVTDGSLAALQKLVGGYIEHVSMCVDAGLLVNEEGRLLGLRPNPFFNGAFVGDVVIVGEPKRGEDNFRSLSEYAADGLFEIFEAKEVPSA